jgi:hypothetical protein
MVKEKEDGNNVHALDCNGDILPSMKEEEG